MSDKEAFLGAIYEQPDDDTPRLVYADWLDDRGEQVRAELIRLQCKIASGSPYTVEEDRRVYQLLEKHSCLWTEGLPEALSARWVFHRGFPEELNINIGVLLGGWPDWSSVPRVRCLTLWGATAGSLQEFAEQNWNPAWTILRFTERSRLSSNYELPEPAFGVKAVTWSPQAMKLSELHFFGSSGIRVGDFTSMTARFPQDFPERIHFRPIEKPVTICG